MLINLWRVSRQRSTNVAGKPLTRWKYSGNGSKSMVVTLVHGDPLVVIEGFVGKGRSATRSFMEVTQVSNLQNTLSILDEEWGKEDL